MTTALLFITKHQSKNTTPKTYADGHLIRFNQDLLTVNFCGNEWYNQTTNKNSINILSNTILKHVWYRTHSNQSYSYCGLVKKINILSTTQYPLTNDGSQPQEFKYPVITYQLQLSNNPHLQFNTTATPIGMTGWSRNKHFQKGCFKKLQLNAIITGADGIVYANDS